MSRSTLLAAALISGCGLAATVQATPVLTNGGFESNLTGWTILNETGGGGTFGLQSGTANPLSGATVAAPTQGTKAAMSDTSGDPGAHLLWQSFTASGTACS
jgi:hypothetical protein